MNMGSSQRDGKASGEELRGDPQRNAEARGSGGVGVVLGGRESRSQGEGGAGETLPSPATWAGQAGPEPPSHPP